MRVKLFVADGPTSSVKNSTKYKGDCSTKTCLPLPGG